MTKHNITHKDIKDVKSEKIKVKTWFGDKDLGNDKFV